MKTAKMNNKKEKKIKVEVILPPNEYGKLMKRLKGKYDTVAYFN